MAKILNRAILVAGERKKVGTPTVTIFELDKSAMVTRASGTATPTDGDAGYAAGCYFHLTSGAVVGGTVYINEGTSSSADFNAIGGGAGSVGNMNSVYENGSTITVDTGAIILNDGTSGSANTLEINKTAAGSGNLIDVDLTAAFTGNVINLDMGSGVAAVGIVIDSEGGARTGADLLITDDSTGTHNSIEINKSGAGASTSFAYTNSYNGSPGGNAISLTFDANDGLSTGGILITRGAGVRTDNAIAISDGSTANTDIIDINITGAVTADILSIVTSAAATGNAIFVNLDSAVAATALHIEGSGTRTQPYVELSSDSVGSAHYMAFTIDGAGSGNFMNFATSTTFTGSVLKFDMEAAPGAKVLFIDASNEIRTDDLIEITADGSGTTDVFEINDSSTRSGHVFDINVSGTGSGDVLNIVYSGASTGDAVSIDLTSGVAASALVVVAAGTRTQPVAKITDSSAGSTHVFDLNIDSTSSGNVIDITVGAVAFTGDALAIDLAATATAASAIVLVGGAVARTVPLVKITDAGTNSGGIMFDINITGINAATVFDIDATAATTGSVFDYATDSASTGTVFEINMTNAVGAKLATYTLAGTRTVNAITVTDSQAGAVDIMQIDVASTSSGHVFDVNVSGNFTGNVLDIVYSASAVQGDAVHVDMGTNLAGNAIQIDAANVRTAPLINIQNTATDGGTDDHVILINQTGLLDSNLIQLTFATAASTGNGIAINMGAAASANVAGMALTITSEGTGVSGEGSAINVDHSGVLVAGADVVSIKSTGAISSTSNALSVATIGDAGSYAIYVSATGSAEGLKVDDGAVVFDETLLVSGLLTYTTISDGTTTLASTTLELNRSSDLSARLVAGGSTETVALATHADRITLLDTLAGTTVTLPAATGSGARYYFVVSVVATSNSHIIQVVGTDIMAGMVWLADSDTSGTTTAFVTASDSDTITLNRTTTGSVTRGEWIELTDAVSGVWLVKGFLTNSGSGATPFSAAV